MFSLLIDKWWLFVVKGILAVLFGVLAFTRPEITLLALIALFGVYAFTDGFLSLAGAFTVPGSNYFGWLLLEGICGIGAGIATIAFPGLTAFTLLVCLGVWLIVAGIGRIVFAVQLRKEIQGEWLYVLGGLCSVVAGGLTLYSPLQSTSAWIWVIAFYSILFGFLSFAVGIRLHGLGSHTTDSKRLA